LFVRFVGSISIYTAVDNLLVIILLFIQLVVRKEQRGQVLLPIPGLVQQVA
jgi:cadmium resistance protein CadD (predicted permease)